MATILFSFVGSCIQKVQEIITEEAIQILGVKQDLRELQQTMTQIQNFLRDADRRRIEDLAVSNWLNELRDAMYDADDIIDIARFKASNLLAGQPSSLSRKLIRCKGFPFLSCFSTIHTRHDIAVQIRCLNKRIEKISELGKTFKFETEPVGSSSSLSNMRRTSHLIEPNLVGKEIIHATNRLVGLVLEHKKQKAYKIGIVGTGGVGKTTLAQKLYNDRRVKGNFKKHAWICVSQQYSEVALMKEILRNIGVHQDQGESIGELKAKLAEAIEERSFFLVLDDLWQSDIWTNLLRTPLHAAAQGTIVVTTRHDTVAKAIGVEHMHRVELMSEEVGWELLWKSMNINDEKEVHSLRDTGIEIVRKCGGLPLAIRVIGSVLATKEKTENQWRKILSNDAWSMNKLPVELRGALYLSYDQLPQYLKQCFLYCALYPEDWTLHRDDLIRFWVAEGFIANQENQQMEDRAEEYYYELISRNLLLPDPQYFDQDRCKMHDLLRQLAHHLSREECFTGDPQSFDGTHISKLRRLSVVKDMNIALLSNLDKQQVRVRTLINFCGESVRLEHSIFKRLLYVRVLDLSGSSLQKIPCHIGRLIHLRLLDLNDTNIICLPGSIGSLKNLQTLNLNGCGFLQNLPSAITQLGNLRHLGLDGTPINQVPKGIGILKFLNHLEGFPIGGGCDNGITMQDGWSLEELHPLLQLRRLDLIELERGAPCSADSLLIDKKYLKVLSLWCTEHTEAPYSDKDVSNIEKIFEQLVPPQNLENLSVGCFFGRRYPTWLGTSHLSSLKYLIFVDCKSCVQLPPIGQLPNLSFLRIERATAVSRIGPEFLGCGVGNPGSTGATAFPKLESLIIDDMPNWEEWTFVVEEAAAAAGKARGGARAAVIRDAKRDPQNPTSSSFFRGIKRLPAKNELHAGLVGIPLASLAVMDKGEAPSPRMRMLPLLNELQLIRCPKLKALPRQLELEAVSLKELSLRFTGSIKLVKDLPFVSDLLSISFCEGLERVSNLSQVRELRVQRCPKLRCVEKLDNLQQLWLAEDMHDISSFWVPELQQHHQQLHGEDLDVYTWTK
ncbi:hypothetical protein ACP70R_008100 [Stipagrostis hirtigluma subsp. patula]